MEITDAMVEAAAARLAELDTIASAEDSYYKQGAKAVLSAALSAAPVAVKVRELQWNVLDDDHWGATALGLSYEIRKSQITGGIRVRGSRNIHEGFMDFDGTVDAAKAAAQADYERRILSALYPALVSEPEPVAWYETKLGEMVAWLLVEKLKKPDDVYYSEEDAIGEIEKAITAPPSTERMREALERWQSYGCPDCGGDCGSANPPVMSCIMQQTREALKIGGAS